MCVILGVTKKWHSYSLQIMWIYVLRKNANYTTFEMPKYLRVELLPADRKSLDPGLRIILLVRVICRWCHQIKYNLKNNSSMQ